MYRTPAGILLLLVVATSTVQADNISEGDVRRCLAMTDDLLEIRHEVDQLAEEVESLERRGKRLGNTIRRLKGRHASARNEMNNARNWMRTYEGQMYNNSFARSEYQRYRSQYDRARYRVNALAQEIRPKVASYNSIVRRQQRLAREHDELREELEDEGADIEARCSQPVDPETLEAVCANDRYDSCARLRDYSD